jgi:hypothetical protein
MIKGKAKHIGNPDSARYDHFARPDHQGVDETI